MQDIIDADDSLGKDFPCNRDEAVVHVTAAKTDLVAFRFWKLTEVFFEVSSPDHRKEIDHGRKKGEPYAGNKCFPFSTVLVIVGSSISVKVGHKITGKYAYLFGL